MLTCLCNTQTQTCKAHTVRDRESANAFNGFDSGLRSTEIRTKQDIVMSFHRILHNNFLFALITLPFCLSLYVCLSHTHTNSCYYTHSTTYSYCNSIAVRHRKSTNVLDVQIVFLFASFLHLRVCQQ